MYQMIISTDDPDRHLPGSWNFQPATDEPADVWAAAMEIARSEKVDVVKIVDDRGREVWE